MKRYCCFLLSILFGSHVVDCFSVSSLRRNNQYSVGIRDHVQCNELLFSRLTRNNEDENVSVRSVQDGNTNRAFATSIAAIFFSFSILLGALPSYASEIGVEVEADTFLSGESVEICTKRGILGACLKTEMRTESNDNDISKKYLRNSNEILKQQKETAYLRSQDMQQSDNDGNALIQRLKQQSIDNAEKNNLLVQRKTFENSQSAAFGPFDRQVLIMNTDGKTFTLLQNPQAMRLKKAGYIDDRRQFIKQPTQEVIDQALESEQDSILSTIFGS